MSLVSPKGSIIDLIRRLAPSGNFSGAKEEVSYNGKILYNLGDFAGIALNSNLVSNQDIKQILIRAGALSTNIDFRPSKSLQARVKNSQSLPTSIRNEGLENWFSTLVSAKNETFYLIPDTNFLLNCYYSNFFKGAIESNKHSLQIVLPRIVNLELENRASNTEDSRMLSIGEMVDKLDVLLRKAEELLKNDFEKTKDGEYNTQGAHVLESKNAKLRENLESINRQLKWKRLSYIAMNEIYSMGYDGAQNMSQLRYPTLFLQNKGLADSLIRLEIADNIQNNSPYNYIFMTADFTNALAASAENLNTLYFHHGDSLIGNATDRIQNILFQTAIQFGECEIKIAGPQTIKLLGVWEGKNQSDWYRNAVQMMYGPSRM